VGGEVGVVVAAGIEMEFVRDVARGKDFVEGGGAGFEAVVVLVAAIEINFQAGEIGGAGTSERTVLLPESGIEGIAEDTSKDAGSGRRRRSGGGESWKLVDDGGAVGADGREELGMAEGEMERAEAAHGDAVDGAVGAAGRDAIAFFDEGKKFLDQEILVAVFAVFCVDVEARAAIGRSDQKIFELVIVAEIGDNVPQAGVDEELFVVAEAVEEIEDGEVGRFVGVEGGRENDAVGDGAREDFAGEGVAFDATWCGVDGEDEEEEEEEGD
jgi:hypothetical protein